MKHSTNDTINILEPQSIDFSMLDYECSYIPGKMTRMNYKYVHRANSSFVTAVIHRGWRRFGKYFFHPICEGCSACKSIRINVNDFKPTKSQRKAYKRNNDTKIILQKPTLSQAHLGLYNKYHHQKHQKDGWSHKHISQREYYENFVDGAFEFGKEVLYVHHGNLVGVDLIDILDDGISAIYFYYDLDYARLSLGVYSLLYQIELAKKLDLQWIYLGYWVDGCKAFAYKEGFNPQQRLDGFPNIYEQANWEETLQKP